MEVPAVEPSAQTRAQRPPDRVAAIDGTAEDLPFADNTFDAAMGTLTVHQWSEPNAGLTEIRRATRGSVVFLTWDPTLLLNYWLYDYAPEAIDTEGRRYPTVEAIAAGLGGAEVISLPIPLLCTDGFSEAYYGRPERLLDPGVRQANSAWSFVAPEVHQRFETSRDLADGTWDAKYGDFRDRPHLDGSLVLVVSAGQALAYCGAARSSSRSPRSRSSWTGVRVSA